MTVEAPPRRHRLAQLDGLRGIAALAVLLYHYGWRVHPELIDRRNDDLAHALFQQAGRNGVFLFFVLSGFLVGGPFVRWLASGPDAGVRRPRLREYAVARAVRILPLWWVVLATVLLVGRPELVSGAGDVLQLLLLQHHLDEDLVREVVGPAWTLCVESWFYVALPVVAMLLRPVVRRLPRAARHLVVVTGLAAAAVASLQKRQSLFGDGYWRPRDDRWELWSLLTFADMFALGMLVALVVPMAKLAPRVAASSALACALALHLFAVDEREQLGAAGPTVVAGAAALVVLALVAHPAGLAARMLSHGVLVRIGVVSYGLYLWHMPLAHGVRSLGWLQPTDSAALAVAQVATTGALAYLLAEASWRFIESPLIDRARARRRGASAPSAPRRPRHAVAASAAVHRREQPRRERVRS